MKKFDREDHVRFANLAFLLCDLRVIGFHYCKTVLHESTCKMNDFYKKREMSEKDMV